MVAVVVTVRSPDKSVRHFNERLTRRGLLHRRLHNVGLVGYHRQQAPSMGSVSRSRRPWLSFVAVSRPGQVVAQLANNMDWRWLRRRWRRRLIR